jgi:regulation of enolase protein 1 (concanavalin A-like superfamily)
VDDRITVVADPRTDFWRITDCGQIRDNGHFYYRRVTGDFCAHVRFSGQYAVLYDQAGLMVRVDEENWLKCGIEFVSGIQHASAVVTRDYSDWSVVPLPSNPATLWLRVARRGSTIEVHTSLDGAHYTMIRSAYLRPAETAQVGLMCAAPEGDGFSVTFEGFAVSSDTGA